MSAVDVRTSAARHAWKLGIGLCVAWVLSSSCSRPHAKRSTKQPTDTATRALSETLLDAFEEPTEWQAEGSDGVRASSEQVPGREGHGLRLSFDFQGHAGYAALRRARPITLPENYEISFDVMGDAPVNDLQLKFIDGSGDNVWWFRRSDVTFPKSWQHITLKKRQVEFAWGPTKDHELRRADKLEFAIAAGKEGGSGYVVLDNLRIRELPAQQPASQPVATASSSAAGGAPALALDGKLDTAWRSPPDGGKEQLFELDLGVQREFGGLMLRWHEGAQASRYDVELSRDGVSWQLARQVREGNGGRDALMLPEAEARYVRLRMLDGPGDHYALSEAQVKELAFGATPNAFISALASSSPRGHYPRGFGEQAYWTLVGTDGGADSGLLSEDGALEVGVGGFSIEPFVVVDGRTTSWADVRSEHALPGGYLPAPSVTWHHPAFELEVHAFAATRPRGASPKQDPEHPGSELWARYTLKNRRSSPLTLKLVLSVRPYQVNPPTQLLNLQGGVSPISDLRWDGSALSVNAGARVFPLVAPDHVGLTTFDAGGFPESAALAGGCAAQHVVDATGFGSGALVYDLQLAPGEQVTLGLVAPVGAAIADRPELAPASLADLAARREQTLAVWREKLGRVKIEVPAAAQHIVDSLRSALAQILMSRAGPILRPGTRGYARAWIRDGAMISATLLRLGHEGLARDFARWYAAYQFDSGKVPCCVDARGADPVPEHDSEGEFIFLVAEIFRFTQDRALLEAMWPHIEAAAAYMEQLRTSQHSQQNQTPERRAFYGLIPPSISHEGYWDKPAWSYWDDFWALLGYEDAASLAAALGKNDASERLRRASDELRSDLIASLRTSAAERGVPYLLGSADRGDFDATATTIALVPGRDANALPRAALLATFEHYFEQFAARRDGQKDWSNYTPYELRAVAAFVRLGSRQRAHELLAYFMRDQRPLGWNQWAEVVGRDPREPRFIGDMPHAWIASDYVRSTLELFAYERPNEHALVLAAGVPLSWFDKPGVTVAGLRTIDGVLSYSARRQGKTLVFELRSPAPPGGFVIPWPAPGEPGRAFINGKPGAWQESELHIRTSPARVVLELPSSALNEGAD